jgi:hypothetical protein
MKPDETLCKIKLDKERNFLTIVLPDGKPIPHQMFTLKIEDDISDSPCKVVTLQIMAFLDKDDFIL